MQKSSSASAAFFVFLLALSGFPVTDCAMAEKDILNNEKRVYSQFDEEVIIRDFFQDKKNGVFLDVGAADYQRNSTTYYLEKNLGWSGVAVDALKYYEDGFLKHRPKTKFEHYIVTDHSGNMETFYITRAIPDVSSTNPNYVQEYAPVTHAVQIKTITLNDLLEKNNIQSLDFLSMDIEDGEPKALAGFDVQKYRPKLVCIEAHETVRDQIYDYFIKNGYERIEKYRDRDKLNYYFTPKKQS